MTLWAGKRKRILTGLRSKIFKAKKNIRKLYYKIPKNVTAWPRNITSVGVQSPTQLLRQKYKTPHALRQQMWKALVDEPIVRHKQTFRGCQRRRVSRKNGSDDRTMRVCIRMFPPPTEQVAFKCHQCAEVTFKLRRQRCLGHVDATCDKFDNRLHTCSENRLPVGNRFTGFPVYCLRSLISTH